jgi:hypothetical protein
VALSLGESRHSPPSSQPWAVSGRRFGSLRVVRVPVGEVAELMTEVEYYRSRFDGARNERPHEARKVTSLPAFQTPETLGLKALSLRSG